MRYVPTDSPAAPTTVGRLMHDLRTAAERRACAGRVTFGGARDALPLATAAAAGTTPAAEAPAAECPAEAARDPLVGLLAELRAVTTRYVRGLRAGGARPEQMLVQVKAFIQDAMAAEGWHDSEAAQALTAEVVGWSIAAYYDQ